MHTIASIALVEDTPRDQILAAGILMGALVLLMELTRVVHLVNRFVPLSVVRGVQLGVGMGLVMKALSNKFMFVQKPVSSTQVENSPSVFTPPVRVVDTDKFALVISLRPQ